MGAVSTLDHFQRLVWESLPIRREAVGREIVNDMTLVAVQCWPVEELTHAARNPKEELLVLNILSRDVRRILILLYGEERFQGYWIIGARVMLPIVIGVIHEYWRRRKDNKAKIVMWRRKWSVE